MSDDGCDLDALLDVLSDDELEETAVPLVEKEPLEPETSIIAEAEDVEDNESDEAVDDDDDNEEEIRQQLAAMEEQMRLMKEKLKKPSAEKVKKSSAEKVKKSSAEKVKKSSAEKVKKPSAEKLKEPPSQINNAKSPKQKEDMDESKVGGGEEYKPEVKDVGESEENIPLAARKRNIQKSSQKEVDLFSSSGTNDSNNRKLKSPVKTQPLKECEKEYKRAKYEANSSEWCPSLMRKDTTRVITGAEAEKLKADLAKKDRQRMESVARRDLMDSSDDEVDEEGNSLLSDYGKDLKRALGQKDRVSRVQSNPAPLTQSPKSAEKQISKPIPKQVEKEKPRDKTNFFVERNTGIRISRPIVTQVQIQAAMQGRRLIPLSRIAEHRARKDTEGDWVTIGVMFYKAPQKTSSTGNEYSLWKLTDLKGDMKPLTVFLFGQAHRAHWKLSLNKVVGILNPKIMEDRQSGNQNKGEVTVSIDHPDKLLEMGDSLDIAKCKFLKPDKTSCTNIVNMKDCEYCLYHIKKAYNSSSAGRSGLQSTFSGLSSEATRTRIMQRVAPLSKGEVFAGGRLMNVSSAAAGGGGVQNAPVGRKTNQEKARDAQIVAGLGSGDRIAKAFSQPSNSPIRSPALAHRGLPSTAKFLTSQEKEIIRRVAKNDSEEVAARLLAPSLGARSMLASLVSQQQTQVKAAPQKTAKDLLMDHSKALVRGGAPKLGRGLSSQSGMVNIDLSPSIKSNYSASHSRALSILQNKNMKLVAEDPNKTHKKQNVSTPERVEKMKKRVERSSTEDENEQSPSSKEPKSKKLKLDEKSPKTVRVFGREMTQEELDKLRSTKSKNKHLVAEAELDATDKYFDTMEKRDDMEAKMLGTFEMKTKAVTCHECNYTSFKASDLCKKEGHRYKVIDAVKRFYHCKKCKKRVTCLTRIPRDACKQCGESNWVRAGMIAERKGPNMIQDTLSVRGNEEKWLGGGSTNSNINV